MTLNMVRIFSLLSGIFILFLALYALVFPDHLMYLGISLFVLYVLVGFIWRHSPPHQFTRFCLGESAAVALWFVSPVLGMITALLITAEFLNGVDVLKNRNGYSLLALWGLGACILAFMSERIQHTLLPCVAVLFIAGIATLALLLIEYRMIFHAGGNES